MVQVKKEEKRKAIQKSAYRLFKRKGYFATTTAGIAFGAKVSESNVYAYFNSKFDILYSLFESWIQKRIQNLWCGGSQIVSGRSTGPDRCIRGYFMILDRLIQTAPAGFSIQRLLLPTMRRCS
jgi:AcrR family transcriptional regulator